MSSLSALVSELPYCMVYTISCQVYSTYTEVLFYTYTHKQREAYADIDTCSTRRSRRTHVYSYTLKPPLTAAPLVHC